ncbi:MAG: hypothetical protein H6937_04090 [Burkholderiales bacterium]|nr:hypothetical protein [Burkholderiales bacterium]MDR4516101.1 hypothetical protein [Nitrosomonas sp.]
MESWIETSSGMTPILDADGITVIGYETTDEWGTTTFYDLQGAMTGYQTVSSYSDGLGYTSTDTFTYDASGNLAGSSHSDSNGFSSSNSTATLKDEFGNITGYVDSGSWSDGIMSESWEYNYDSNWMFQGGTRSDGTTTWTYDNNWNIISQSMDVSGMTPTLGADGATVIGYETTDEWGITTFYDLQGAMTGYQTVSNYSDGLGYTSTDTFTYDANGNLTGSSHSDSNGFSSSNSTVTLKDEFGNITGYVDSGSWSDGIMSESWEYNYDSNWMFQGGTRSDGTTTWTYDNNWNIISQSMDASGMTPILGADGVTVIGYETTDEFGTTTFYDLQGAMTGYQTVSSYSDGLGYTSTDTFTYDANGNLTGSSHSDSNGFSSSNSTVTLKDDFGNITGYVDSGSWSDGIMSESWEYNYDSNWMFQGGTRSDGATTWTYDNNWNIIGQSMDVSGMTPTLDTDGITVIGYESTDEWGTTTFYDLMGAMTGYQTVSSYDNGYGSISTDIFTYDANGNQINSFHSYSDGSGYASTSTQTTLRDGFGNIRGYVDNGSWSDGIMSESWEYNYDSNWMFQGGTRSDGATTWTYDNNWNIVSQSMDVSGMTPTLGADGVTVIGYETSDEFGTTTFYDLMGAMTGYQTVSSYDNGYGSISMDTFTYDANGNLLSSTYSYSDGSGYTSTSTQITLRDEFGNITGYVDSGSWSDGVISESWEYNYDSNWMFQGGTRSDGATTWTYDSNWNIISQSMDASGMTPTLGADGVTVIGYETTDEFGTTTFYDLQGAMTGYQTVSSYSDGLGYTSTDTFTYDANGNLTGSSHSDSNGFSSSNSTVTLKDEFGNITGYVDSGSWSDGIISESWEYNYDSNWMFQGGTRSDGATTWTYDSNWNIIGQSMDVSGMTPILDTDGITVIGYETTDEFGTTTFYDLLGAMTGYQTVSSFDNGYGSISTDTFTYDANGNQISSFHSYSDGSGYTSTSTQITLRDEFGNITGYVDSGSWSDGIMSESWEYNYDSNWMFQGGTRSDGATTWAYDSNWNVIGSSISDTIAPSNLGNGILLQNDGGFNGTADVGDTLVFDFSEAIGNKNTIESFFSSNSTFGNGVILDWLPTDSTLNVTLGMDETYNAGTEIVITGVEDIAGNSADITFSFI